MKINLPLEKMGALLSHERRVAVPFYRDERRVTYLQFEPAGPVARDLPATAFDRNYTKSVDLPLEAVALKLIGAARTCYLPGSRVMSILLEIFNMTQTNGTPDLTGLSQAELTDTYNKLADAAKRGPVKSFKDKATAIARIQALQAEIAQPSAAQAEHAKEAEEKAAKTTRSRAKPAKETMEEDSTSGLAKAIHKMATGKEPAEKKPEPSAHAKKVAAQAAKAVKQVKEAKAAKAPAQKSAKAAKPEGEKKPRGQGIGAYACEVILKNPAKGNEEVLELVKKKFPDASTSASSIAWYRNKLKQEGQLTG